MCEVYRWKMIRSSGRKACCRTRNGRETAMRQVVVQAIDACRGERPARRAPFLHHVPHRPSRRGDPAAAARAVSAGDDHRPAAPVLGPEDGRGGRTDQRRPVVRRRAGVAGHSARRGDRRSPIRTCATGCGSTRRSVPEIAEEEAEPEAEAAEAERRDAGRDAAGGQPGCVPPPHARRRNRRSLR